MDTRRWILVEAWLNLGLRVEWAPGYRDPPGGTWQRDDEENREFYYEGHRTWLVRRRDATYRPYGDSTVPTLGTETLRHELAHYLSATKEQREMVNFGAGEAEEERAVATEEVLDAMLQAAGRVADLALLGGRR